MASGVLATGNSLRVARFTPLSVACADSTTATNSSNGVLYSSSVVGCGLTARRRLKISWRFAEFMVWRSSPGSLLGETLLQGLALGAGRLLVLARLAGKRHRDVGVARLGHALLQRRLHAAAGTAVRARCSARALFQLCAAIRRPSPRKAPGGRMASRKPL